MYKLVIFDLDGTLADTIESMAKAGNKTLERLGLQGRPDKEYKYFAGDGADELVRRMLRAAGDKTLDNEEQAIQLYHEYFKLYCTYHVTPYEGIREMLEHLKEKKIKIGILTNKPHEKAIKVVNDLFGEGYIDYVLGQQKGINKKPDPEGALMIVEHFGVNPLECLYVGDTNVDMITGNRAGMFTIGVLWGFRDRKELEENNANVIIAKPSELLVIMA